MVDKQSLNELALFAGAGGGILGGHLLGWRTVCAVEWEQYPASVLCARQNDGLLPPFPIWDDVQTFKGEPWRGIVDVISGGFPCTDISAAGKGAGIDGEASGMWREMARIIHEVRPRYVFVENSPMLTSRGLGRVLGDLAAMGFDARWGVLGAADVGAPHQRDRIWIVAKWRGQLPHAQHHRIRWWEQQQKSLKEANREMANTDSISSKIGGDDFSNEKNGGGWNNVFRGSGSNDRGQFDSKENGKMANSDIIGLDESKTKRDRIQEQQVCQNELDYGNEIWSETFGCGQLGNEEELANPTGVGFQGQGKFEQPINSKTYGDWKAGQSTDVCQSDFWATEPNVGRVVNGMASRVDRIKALGNGQVPLCAATAWRILK
jgi:DNA (cytosine-5)-methyltransferase 1